jgi:microsomal dipeptidase-like Zn-dependent dipeptidase
VGWAALAWNAERLINRVEAVPLPAVSATARALHDASTVVDLHADSLLFGRDLTRRSAVGHVDLPRLREGGVALQVFGAATVAPAGMNIERTERGAFDLLGLLFCLRLSPGCVGGPSARLASQASGLAATIARDPRLVWVRSAADLARLLEQRAQDPAVVGGILAIEGAHALEEDPAALERAAALGVRMIGLAHFTDNAYAGSAHGVAKGGLSDLGRRTLARMEELGIAADLAHLAPAAIDELLALATKPVLVSHGGAQGTCDNARTLSDAQLRAIAANGGVVGIGYWQEAVCGIAPRDVARAIRYVADLVGDDHVALGSDYDGGTTVAFDASQLPVLTQALLDAGLGEASIRKILGGNALRVLAATLP